MYTFRQFGHQTRLSRRFGQTSFRQARFFVQAERKQEIRQAIQVLQDLLVRHLPALLQADDAPLRPPDSCPGEMYRGGGGAIAELSAA